MSKNGLAKTRFNGHRNEPSEPVALVVFSVFFMATGGSFFDELRSLELMLAFSERSNWKNLVITCSCCVMYKFDKYRKGRKSATVLAF